jgi:ABC-type branched-subunit amino acid transport system ATPase component
MQDRPTAAELLDSVAEYLFAELRPEVPQEQRFKVLVAANVCAVVAREIRAGEEPDQADLALFEELLGKEVADVHAAAAELSERIRSGELDDRIEELAPRLEQHVQRKLDIARPGYSEGE